MRIQELKRSQPYYFAPYELLLDAGSESRRAVLPLQMDLAQGQCRQMDKWSRQIIFFI
jgi:hypothetical protein